MNASSLPACPSTPESHSHPAEALPGCDIHHQRLRVLVPALVLALVLVLVLVPAPVLALFWGRRLAACLPAIP